MKYLLVLTLACLVLVACGGPSNTGSEKEVEKKFKSEKENGGNSSSDQEGIWELYFNQRFDFCMKYPSHLLTRGTPPSNGDGLEFLTQDKKGKILAWGTYMLTGETLQENFELEAEDGEDYEGRQRRVTYKKLGNDWHVTSGFLDEEIIFYRKVKAREDDAFACIEFEYPKEKAELWDPIVKRVTASWPDCD